MRDTNEVQRNGCPVDPKASTNITNPGKVAAEAKPADASGMEITDERKATKMELEEYDDACIPEQVPLPENANEFDSETTEGAHGLKMGSDIESDLIQEHADKNGKMSADELDIRKNDPAETDTNS
ncbi:hypothetical protein BH10BAC5_BH10BAC5_17110 [soil metagenome]